MLHTPSQRENRDSSPQEHWDLRACLHRLSHWLPSQGPIRMFVHHNTLHAFQHYPFHEGLLRASRLFGARTYLSLGAFHQAYRGGQISESALERVGKSLGLGPEALARWKKEMLTSAEEPAPPGLLRHGLRRRRRIRENLDMDSLVHPILFRFLSAYLDQGISLWSPSHGGASLWPFLGNLVDESLLPVLPFSDPWAKEMLRLSPETAVLRCLERLVGDPRLYEPFLLETLLAHPGWSGMVSLLESQPQQLVDSRPITLIEALALELTAETCWMVRKKGERFRPEGAYGPPDYGSLDRVESEGEAPSLSPRWLEAHEWSLYEPILAGLRSNHLRREQTKAALPEYQTFFCIDDRECSLRRHLEQVNPNAETFATAGFFSVEFFYRAAEAQIPFAYCPVIITPKHLIQETSESEEATPVGNRPPLTHTSNTLFRGWLLTQLLGFGAFLRLIWGVFHPGSARGLLAPQTKRSKTSLKVHRTSDEPNGDGLWEGFTWDEMADRITGLLRGTGLVKEFSPLVVFIGHGASSVNNPHFSAYDCGACSGKPGAPNARVAAWMANQPQVRERLKDRGISVPEGTFFLGGFHDTTKDEVTFLDTDEVPPSHRPLLEKAKTEIEEALNRNAKERCERFELAPSPLTPTSARKHVRNRSLSLFEPRPEWNHATNALAIVGRRSLTRGLSLERRAFLNSYDPALDPDGAILVRILGAVVPVCGGINLEYYFSKVDNDAFGAGTKLSHNVVSLIGVANGVEGDLLTGLPAQMVEIHDPVRLLIVVEQELEVVEKAARSQPGTWEWIENDWVHLVSLSPSTGQLHWFQSGTPMEVLDLPGFPLGSPGSPTIVTRFPRKGGRE